MYLPPLQVYPLALAKSIISDDVTSDKTVLSTDNTL